MTRPVRTDDLAFGGVPLPARSAKPRETGLTITVEFGIGTAAQEDLLLLAGDTIDLAKIVVSVARLLPRELLRRKVELYRAHGVEAFPGGMFLEYAEAAGCVGEFLEGALDAGFRVLEVSDNAAPLAAETKARLVRGALECGFVVLGEVGSKHTVSAADALVEDAQRLLDAGCWKVLVEAAELIQDGAVRGDLVAAIEARLPLEHVVFELPGTWLPGVHGHEVHALEAWLVDHFGPEVNIANDAVGNSLFLETLRRGIGPNLRPAAAPAAVR